MVQPQSLKPEGVADIPENFFTGVFSYIIRRKRQYMS